MATQIVESSVDTRSVSAGPAARYLAVMFVSVLISGSAIAGYLQYLNVAGLLPPLPLTGSISFDEKAAFVRKSLHGEFDILAVGSSMTMNNLSSDAFVDGRPRQRVLNIAAWGMRMSDSRRWLDHVLRRVRVQKVLMVTGPMDFYAPYPWLGNISDSDLDTFLSEQGLTPLLFLRKFSLQSYARPMATYRLRRDHYLSLQFDRGGGVAFEVYYPNVNLDLWNSVIDPDLLTEDEYRELELMAKGLRSRGVQFVVARAPMRLRALRAGGARLERHWDRVEKIVRDSGQQFMDLSHELPLDDSHFADFAHLNAKGVAAFTQAVIGNLPWSAPNIQVANERD